MSDTTMSKEKEQEQEKDKKTLTLSRPGRLELKKRVESGLVRQSFSHGRSKTVMVERKTKKSFERSAEGRMREVVARAPELEEPVVPEEVQQTEQVDEQPVVAEPIKNLTEAERATRLQALQSAKLEEDRRRVREEEEAARRIQEQAEAEKRAAEEAERQAAEAAAQAAALGAPDDTLLEALLVKLFADRQIAVAPEVIRFLSARMDRSAAAARALVEALDRRALETGRAVTVPLARAVLRDRAEAEP